MWLQEKKSDGGMKCPICRVLLAFSWSTFLKWLHMYICRCLQEKKPAAIFEATYSSFLKGITMVTNCLWSSTSACGQFSECFRHDLGQETMNKTHQRQKSKTITISLLCQIMVLHCYISTTSSSQLTACLRDHFSKQILLRQLSALFWIPENTVSSSQLKLC
jgi:hypothetical protein